MELIPIEELRNIIQYTLDERGDRHGGFDVVMEGTTPQDPRRGALIVAPYADAGLTWWVERLGWFRGPIDQMRSRVRAGPPLT
jgi:hypothetical protein